MWKVLKNVIRGMKEVKKFGSLVVTVLDIVGYSADRVEKWVIDNEPAEVPEIKEK
jgi:hypothetical protein